MADKEKRIQKFLTKIGLKGKLKSVKTLEEATVVVVEDPRDRIHFLTSTNPRNKGLVERGIFTKSKVYGSSVWEINPLNSIFAQWE